MLQVGRQVCPHGPPGNQGPVHVPGEEVIVAAKGVQADP